jgi:hypothetical protein
MEKEKNKKKKNKCKAFFLVLGIVIFGTGTTILYNL